MKKAVAQSFEAALEKGDASLGWTIARVPFNPADVWVERVRQRVKGTVNGFAFRTSLFPCTGETGRYFLLVSQAMQKGGGARAGQVAAFTLEPDLDPRPAELPEKLDSLLDEADGMRAWYETLTEYTRREIGKWVQGVKSDGARVRRAQQMAERILFAMEGEVDLPPAIAKAMRARPRATEGWAAMTPAQKRSELLAVGYYQSPEARAKRIGKLGDLAEKHAARHDR
jgi:uncharacterized protein YdeI (YjbR/CyaY-like superfamily)